MKTAFTLLAAFCLDVSIGTAGENAAAEKQRIGAMVLEIQAALETPGDPKSLETIVNYGHDTRYYVMIRGWMVELRSGVHSQLDATQDPELKKKHRKAHSFLEQVIRGLDLE